MTKNFWKELAARGPIVALAPMDGYCDSAYRQVCKTIAPNVIPFSEFYSADGLVHSKDLAKRVLPHADIEKPLIIQIFGKDPEKFRQAAIIIESYGVSGIDINMGCPAKKVVKSGHGSSLMINRDTAFRIVEEMAKAVKIPISVKTRLGWDNHDLLVDFCKGLENAGADLISVHGRTYKQAFTGKADFTGIYDLRQHLGIPVVANGDIMGYADGTRKILHPANRDTLVFPGEESVLGTGGGWKNLDGFMIGRASFGNPWCFLPDGHRPTLGEILEIMELHARLLIETK
jgi:tRNA-dihydrouridine synthase B